VDCWIRWKRRSSAETARSVTGITCSPGS
jgi:hypothetical protein